MFTGIVQGTGQVVGIVDKEGLRTYQIRFPKGLTEGLITGASVANNGCCLTVTQVEGDVACFDLMQETLKRTNLGTVGVGDLVNLERSAKMGDEIGGHVMSGHIICLAKVQEVVVTPNNHMIWFKLPDEMMKYIFPKGFVGIDGISLTIGDVADNSFNVYLIPETLQRTNLGTRQKGDMINIEIDPQTQATVDTVERVLAARFDG